jgi:hypothetical protein
MKVKSAKEGKKTRKTRKERSNFLAPRMGWGVDLIIGDESWVV